MRPIALVGFAVTVLMTIFSTTQLLPTVAQAETHYETYKDGRYTYVIATGHWETHRDRAKRTAEREAQVNYASTRSVQVYGETYMYQDGVSGYTEAQEIKMSRVSPSFVKIVATEILEEETRNEYNPIQNQEWRFTVRVKIDDHEFQNSVKKEIFGEDFATKDRSDVSAPMTSRDYTRYALYGGAVLGAAVIITNPWLLFFL